jgi:hypothetical protein
MQTKNKIVTLGDINLKRVLEEKNPILKLIYYLKLDQERFSKAISQLYDEKVDRTSILDWTSNRITTLQMMKSGLEILSSIEFSN